MTKSDNGMFGLRVEFVSPGCGLELREQFYRLRFAAFGELENSDPTLGMEYDEHDAYAPCVLVFDEERLVGGVRLLLCEQGPITLDLSLVNQDERHGELSRFTIDETVKDKLKRKQINFVLCSVISEYAFEELGYQTLYCDARKFFYDILLGLLGESLETLGPQHTVEKPGRSVTLVPICVRRSEVPTIRARFMTMLSIMQARMSRSRVFEEGIAA